VDVLLVEDDPGDVLMTREAFEHYKIRNVLHVVTDGEQALQFLRRTGDVSRWTLSASWTSSGRSTTSSSPW